MPAFHSDENNRNDRPVENKNAQPAKPIQPPSSGVSRIPGNYSGGYSGYGSPTSGGGITPDSLGKGRKLIVGDGINLSGEIDACDHLIVEGKVEAALKGASYLDIAETGVFYGTVEIDEAVIAGRFEGDLTVNGRLTIRSSGSITGAISYKELAVEAGATVDGKISPLKDRADNRAKTTQSYVAPPSPSSTNAGDNNTGNQQVRSGGNNQQQQQSNALPFGQEGNNERNAETAVG